MTTKFEDFILADSNDGAVVVGLNENDLNAGFPATVFAGTIPPNLIFGGTQVAGLAIQEIPVGEWTPVYWEGWPGGTGTPWILQEDRIRIKCPAGIKSASGVFQIYSGVAWENTDPALVGVHRRRVRIMQEIDGVLEASAWGTEDYLFFPDMGDLTQLSYTQVIVNMMFPWAEIQEHDCYIWMEVWHNAEVPINLHGSGFDAPLWMSSYLSEFQSRTITPPDPPIEVAAELVYLSTTAFDGYRSTFGMVNTDPTGDYLLFSHTGYGRVMVSDDAGVTFAESSSFGGGAGNTSNWRVLDFRWDAFNSRFQGHIRRVDTRTSYWSTLEPAVTTWVAQTNQGTYNRGCLIDESGNFYQGGFQLGLYYGLPWSVKLSYTSGLAASTQTASVLQATETLLFHGYAKESMAEPYYVRVVPKDFSSQGTYYGAVFADTIKVASRGEGIVLGYRSTSGTIVTLDKLDVTSGVIQITIDFGTNLSFADICYSPELDGYMVVAIDADDNRLAHIRYNVGDETATWIATDSVYLNGYVESDSYRQIVHAVGDVYYYAYLQAYGTLNVSTLERITLNDTPPNPNIIETVFIHNYETYGAGVYTATVGDDLNAASLPQNATAKYGSWAMGYTGANRAQIDADVDIDPNNFTLELYYNAQSLAADAGIFFYGTTSQDAVRLQAIVTTTGSLELLYKTGTGSRYFITTAAGLITTGVYNEICFEADRAGQMAYIYLNGVVVGSGAMIRSVWNGSQDFYLGYARSVSTGRWSLGYIDSTRLSKGARYGGAGYTPHVGPFTS